jgi:predicted histone-like DNA-binding protein
MAQYFKKYQNNVRDSKMFGKWYGRAVTLRTVEVEELAAQMQDNCTVKRADILAVLSELGPTMKKFMEESKSVKLPYLGTFKYGISTEGAESESDFTAQNVKKVRVLFQPITSREAGGKTVQEMTRSVKVREYKNVEPGESSSSSGGGGLTPVEPEEP